MCTSQIKKAHCVDHSLRDIDSFSDLGQKYQVSVSAWNE